MNSIPDFTHQVQEVERKLKAEWQSVQEGWQDNVAERFNERIMEPYLRNFQQYITGEGIGGLGVDLLVRQMEKHEQDMASIVGD